jgi:drug/metabolite transporter (DMT)-like permease
MSRNILLGALAALAAAIIGSGWQIASRHAVTTTLGPLDLAVLRYAIPTLLFLPLLWRTGLFPAGMPKHRLALIVLCSGLPFGLLVTAGVQWAPAAHLGIFMNASIPLLTAIGALWIHGEALSKGRIAGLALVAAGIVVFGAQGLDAQSWRGDVLFVAAGLLWSIYTVLLRRIGLTPWQSAVVVNAWSTILLVPLVLWLGAPGLFRAPWGDVAFQAVGQGIFAGVLGIVAYNAAISRLGAARASLSAALVPLLTAGGAAWLLGEALTVPVITGALLVAIGIALAVRSTMGSTLVSPPSAPPDARPADLR